MYFHPKIAGKFIIAILMMMGVGGLWRAFFCEMVQVAVEIASFWAFGFQLDGEMMNAKF